MIVLLHHTAEKYLNRLNATDRDRLRAALKNLEKEPPEGDITAITGEPGRFRGRVGSYRFLFRITDDAILIKGIIPQGKPCTRRLRRLSAASRGVLNPIFPYSLDHVRASATAISLISSITHIEPRGQVYTKKNKGGRR